MADAWVNELADVHRTVQDERKKQHHMALEKWKASGLHLSALVCRNLKYFLATSCSTYTYCSALEAMTYMLGPFLKNLEASMGYIFTVIAGGLDLSHPGKISILEYMTLLFPRNLL